MLGIIVKEFWRKKASDYEPSSKPPVLGEVRTSIENKVSRQEKPSVTTRRQGLRGTRLAVPFPWDSLYVASHFARGAHPIPPLMPQKTPETEPFMGCPATTWNRREGDRSPFANGIVPSHPIPFPKFYAAIPSHPLAPWESLAPCERERDPIMGSPSLSHANLAAVTCKT